MEQDPDATRQPAIIGVACMLLFLSTLSVVLRLLFRRTTELGLWYDDYTIIAALIMSWISPISILVGLRDGLGRHAYALQPEQVTAYMKVLYAFEISWTFTVPVIKLSLLLLFNRIFPIKAVRYATYVVGFFVVTWLLWAGIATIAQCTPTNYFWNREILGHCINNNAFYISAGAVNVFTNFAIIAIPVPIIWRLQKISLGQKLGFIFIFTLGGWICIVSIIRLVYIGRISPKDITWTDAWGAMWSAMEVSLDVVAANLPVVAPGLFKLFRSGGWSWSHIRSSFQRSSKNKSLIEINIAEKVESDDSGGNGFGMTGRSNGPAELGVASSLRTAKGRSGNPAELGDPPSRGGIRNHAGNPAELGTSSLNGGGSHQSDFPAELGIASHRGTLEAPKTARHDLELGVDTASGL